MGCGWFGLPWENRLARALIFAALFGRGRFGLFNFFPLELVLEIFFTILNPSPSDRARMAGRLNLPIALRSGSLSEPASDRSIPLNHNSTRSDVVNPASRGMNRIGRVIPLTPTLSHREREPVGGSQQFPLPPGKGRPRVRAIPTPQFVFSLPCPLFLALLVVYFEGFHIMFQGVAGNTQYFGCPIPTAIGLA
jgi:hypothetical protein